MANEMLVVRSKIKSAADGCNVAGDFAEALSSEVRRLVQRAAARAKANGRRTVKSRDL